MLRRWWQEPVRCGAWCCTGAFAPPVSSAALPAGRPAPSFLLLGRVRYPDGEESKVKEEKCCC